MTDAISEYQHWKRQGDDLRMKAKQAIEMRYRQLLLEAAQLAEEYRADFGGTLKNPSGITTFRFKAGLKRASTKKAPAKKPAAVPAAEKPANKPAPPEKKLVAPPAEKRAKAETKPAKAEPAKAEAKLFDAKPNVELKALRRRLEAEQAKLEAAKAKGTPTRNIEDRIYEIEDDIRLATLNSQA